MKTNQTYSLNTSVVEEFNRLVGSQKRSHTIEKLMAGFVEAKKGEDV